MSNFKIYHNPRCRKSRETLNLLRESGVEPEIVEYLKTPLPEAELRAVLTKLDGVSAEKVIRKGESEFKENFKGVKLTRDAVIKAIVKYPKLMERPIVVKGDKAVIGRPPENVKTLL